MTSRTGLRPDLIHGESFKFIEKQSSPLPLLFPQHYLMLSFCQKRIYEYVQIILTRKKQSRYWQRTGFQLVSIWIPARSHAAFAAMIKNWTTKWWDPGKTEELDWEEHRLSYASSTALNFEGGADPTIQQHAPLRVSARPLRRRDRTPMIQMARKLRRTRILTKFQHSGMFCQPWQKYQCRSTLQKQMEFRSFPPCWVKTERSRLPLRGVHEEGGKAG